MRITTCETRTQLIVYSVSLLLFLFFVMHPCLFLFLAFSCLVSAGSAQGKIDDAHAPHLRLPSWANCLIRTAVDAFHDQI